MEQNLIKLFLKVGDEIGKGYTENIYQEGLCVLLREQSIIYSKESILPKYFNSVCIGNVRADIILESEKIVIECKSIEGNLRDFHLPQIIVYMEILNYTKGYYVNFNQNPSKDFVEIYTVIKNSQGNYKFTNQIDLRSIYLNNKGKLINVEINKKELQIELNWIKNNIITSESEILYKQKCKEAFPQFSKTFFENIEKHCNNKFCNKQIKNIKYTQVIPGFKIN
jgi:GxxExxY protein